MAARLRVVVDTDASIPNAGERMFVRLGTPPDPSAAGQGSGSEAPPTPKSAGTSCYEVEMRDGLLWIVRPDLDANSVREKIELAQRGGVPLFVVEGTVLCQGTDGEPVIEAESTEVLSSFTARHLRLEERPDLLHRHV